jgi:hypothetical protein
MTTAEEQTNSLLVDVHLTKVLVHCGGVGGGTALLIYTQSWYAESLQDSLPLLLFGLLFWLITIGAFSWTMWEFIIPTFVASNR